jgi:O-acetyl-ADP-ribose deacetylase (regulator of RNase III)
MGRIVAMMADLAGMDVDAIVNPANSGGVMGGGVAYHIKREGGDIIEEEAVKQAPIPVGKAVMTTSGRLMAGHVIHAPTMERPAMGIPVANVRAATRAALDLAVRKRVGTIAFPGMGTGVGGVSKDAAALAMVDEIRKRLGEFEVVYLVGVDKDLVGAFRRSINLNDEAD